MKTIIVFLLALFFMIGCGGGEGSETMDSAPEEKPEEQIRLAGNEYPECPKCELIYPEEEFWSPEQCLTLEHVEDFQCHRSGDCIYEWWGFRSSPPTIHFVKETPRRVEGKNYIREGDIVKGDLTKAGIERLKQSTRECVEALNWVLPDEFGEIKISDEDVPEGNYRYNVPPYDKTYIDLNTPAVLEERQKSNRPFIGGFTARHYIVLLDWFAWLLEEGQASEFDLPYRVQQERELRAVICHELMHILGFNFHTIQLKNRERINAFSVTDSWSLLGFMVGGNVATYATGGRNFLGLGGVGPYRVLGAIDALALRKAYGGNDIEEWLEKLTPPGDCPYFSSPSS